MQLLDGKLLSASIQEKIARKINVLKGRGDAAPHLAAVLVGNNDASETYVRSKIKACEKIGFRSTLLRFRDDVSEGELVDAVHLLNQDVSVHGILVQLPLPPHINVEQITAAISPEKDVDGFHPENIGKMVKGLPCFLPATPFGILLLLERYQVETKAKHCVVLGRSNIVGTPVSILLSRNAYPGNCTVTLAHSKSRDLKEICLQANILIAAIGKPDFVKSDWVKEGAVVIDVGINRVDDSNKKSGYRLKGDVDFDQVAPKCSFITPVPGGVGPLTIAALLINTMKAAKMDFSMLQAD